MRKRDLLALGCGVIALAVAFTVISDVLLLSSASNQPTLAFSSSPTLDTLKTLAADVSSLRTEVRMAAKQHTEEISRLRQVQESQLTSAKLNQPSVPGSVTGTVTKSSTGSPTNDPTGPPTKAEVARQDGDTKDSQGRLVSDLSITDRWAEHQKEMVGQSRIDIMQTTPSQTDSIV